METDTPSPRPLRPEVWQLCTKGQGAAKQQIARIAAARTQTPRTLRPMINPLRKNRIVPIRTHRETNQAQTWLRVADEFHRILGMSRVPG